MCSTSFSGSLFSASGTRLPCALFLAGVQGYLSFTQENRKFQLENQMVRAIPFGKLQKIWAVIWGDAIFLLFQVSLADADRFYNNSHSRNLAFNCLLFMHEISNRMVFVNGKHPSFSRLPRVLVCFLVVFDILFAFVVLWCRILDSASQFILYVHEHHRLARLWDVNRGNSCIWLHLLI